MPLAFKVGQVEEVTTIQRITSKLANGFRLTSLRWNKQIKLRGGIGRREVESDVKISIWINTGWKADMQGANPCRSFNDVGRMVGLATINPSGWVAKY